jgi:hypothetical protein
MFFYAAWPLAIISLKSFTNFDCGLLPG